MFEKITDSSERGQVGIGTLIVFIAMVLVAAIAAGVLINTAGSLQSQASDTGTETQQAVANQIEVTHAVAENPREWDDSGEMWEEAEIPAEVGDGEYELHESEDIFNELKLTVKQSAGSDVIDFTSMTVQYTSGDESKTLAHEEVAGDVQATPDEEAEAFFVTQDATSGDEMQSLTSTDDRANVIIPLVGDEDDWTEDQNQPNSLEPGDSLTVELVDQSGAQYSYGVTMPQTVSDDQFVVEV
ncbi:archaellin/type IV pilin N-terminal domain-containing protein [Natronococcus sp.]|uniref:archaellin/type IV pilin N-terminal domain-containing protein n=1 Tax=Natronococcus sp. TaxID=35747 RepID=UPI0025E758A1|nr:archaellin/type IV pilin N-terminal domain-containing protein [Natronococcus sp.]